MNLNQQPLVAAALGLCLSTAIGQTPLPQVPVTGPAKRLSSVEYWPAPDDKKVKLRLEGAEMTPLGGTTFDVKELTVEQFSQAGRVEAVVMAPECIYAPWTQVAHSPGHLQLKLMDDKVHVEGDGFLWQQTNQCLIISNNVSTVIKMGAWNLSTPLANR